MISFFLSRRPPLAITLVAALLMTAVFFTTWKYHVECYELIASRCRCKILFLGDSITSEGGVWAWRLGRRWPDTRNLGRPGADIDFIKGVAAKNVPIIRPECVVLMAGINHFRPDRDAEQVIKDYAGLVECVRQTKDVKHMIIASTLYVRDGTSTPDITRLNDALRGMCARDGMVFLDLRPLLCRDGRLVPELSRDKVHLNEQGYETWTRALLEVLPEAGR